MGVQLNNTAFVFDSQWYRCTQVMEYELIDLLTAVTHLPWSPWANYKNIDVEELLYNGKLANPKFFLTMYERPDIYSHAFRFMASIAVSSMDWRVMQILQGFHSLLRYADDSETETMETDGGRQILFPPCISLSELSVFALHFPTELQALLKQPSVTFAELNERIEQCLFAHRENYSDMRNQVWLLLMLSGCLLRETASQVINGDDCQEVSVAIQGLCVALWYPAQCVYFCVCLFANQRIFLV